MTEWQRCRRDCLCGRCGGQLHVGDPMLVISITGVRPKVRCERCEGPAPPDLPALVEQRAPLPTGMTQLSVVAGRFVFPVAEREPGEEG